MSMPLSCHKYCAPECTNVCPYAKKKLATIIAVFLIATVLSICVARADESGTGGSSGGCSSCGSTQDGGI